MNLRQMETFYWAVKLGSFTAAARRLSTTQSTVSMRVHELERDLGARLFDRSQRAARATAQGRELLPYAEQALRLAGEIRDRVAKGDATPGVVRMGVAEIVSITWLPRLVKAIHERYPRLRLELDEALTQDLVDRLNHGSLDIILAPGRVPGYNLTPVSLGWVAFAWMSSPALGLPSRPLRPRELQNWPVIALSRESHHHTSIEEWFRSGDAHCRRIDTCKSMGVAASLAMAGLGVTLLPPRCFQREIADGRLRLVDTTPPFPPVEFTATGSVETMHPAVRRIALLAQELTDFDRAPAAAASSAEAGPAATSPAADTSIAAPARRVAGRQRG
jgi:DNA-binding transcriptional LysR family regulator